MSISVTLTSYVPDQEISGSQRRRGHLDITGLTAGGDNTVPHGLGYTPTRVGLRPQKDGTTPGGWSETSLPDGTNVYITVNANGSTKGSVDVWE